LTSIIFFFSYYGIQWGSFTVWLPTFFKMSSFVLDVGTSYRFETTQGRKSSSQIQTLTMLMNKRIMQEDHAFFFMAHTTCTSETYKIVRDREETQGRC